MKKKALVANVQALLLHHPKNRNHPLRVEIINKICAKISSPQSQEKERNEPEGQSLD